MAEGERTCRRWLTVLLTGIMTGVLSRGAWAQLVVKRVVGSDVALNVTYRGDPTEINWNVDGNKVVEMELRPELQITPYRNRHRTNISPTNGSLIIRNLMSNDSGLYKAEVLEGHVIQETEIRLLVVECPAEPTISDQSTPDFIHLVCETPTKGVTYEWRNTTHLLLSNNQSYLAPRPPERVTLTCVVYVDDEVCKKSAQETILPIPTDPSKLIAVVVVIVLLLIAIAVIVLCCYIKKQLNRGTNVQPKLGENQTPLLEEEQLNRGTNVQPVSDVDQTPLLEEGKCSVAVDLPCKGEMSGYKLWKDGSLLYEVQLGECVVGQPRKIRRLYVNVTKVNPDNNEFSAQAHLPGGVIRPIVLEVSDGNRVAFDVPDEKEVTAVELKKLNEVCCHWKLSGSGLRSDEITLEPGSVTIHKPGGCETYKVDVNSAENQIASEEFNLEVVQKDDLTIKLKVEREPRPGNGHVKKEFIFKVTFHPNVPGQGGQVTWKRGGQKLAEDDKFKQNANGDLTISSATSAEEGTYSVHREDETLIQMFRLLIVYGRKIITCPAICLPHEHSNLPA